MEKETRDAESVLHPLCISETLRNTIRDFLRNKLTGNNKGICFFRRFDRLIRYSEPTSIVRHFGPDVCEKFDSLSSLDDLDVESVKKSVEIKHKWFSGFSYKRSIRDEHPFLLDKEIYLHSNEYSQVDMSLNYTFEFSEAKPLRCHITPRNEDLLFIFISNKNIPDEKSKENKKFKPRADAWCVVSEQFLRAWTLIQYDWHETFDKYIPIATPFQERERALREKLFIGNKLMTNSWLKRFLSLEAEGKTMTTEESREKYWHLRTEYVSRKWVDVYAALVLMVRYGELPCPVNLPNNSSTKKEDTLCRRKKWSLPDFFVTMVLTKCARELYPAIPTEHLINYELWRNHSSSSIMFSIHGCKQRGFFDDIHQVQLNENLVTKDKINNTAIPSLLNDFFPTLDYKIINVEENIEENIEEYDDISVINTSDTPHTCGTWADIVKTNPRDDT